MPNLFHKYNMIDLKRKDVLITESSRGIGQQIALGMAKLGCNIIVQGRTKESCVNTLELLKKYNVNTYIVSGELTDDLSAKLKNTGVRINTLDPGRIRTNLGGLNADHAVEDAIPGALAPALIANDGPNGAFFQ